MNQTNNYYRVGPHVLRIGCVEPLETSALLPSFAPFALPVEEGEEAAEVIEVDICPSEVAAVTDVEDTFPQPVSFEWENARCTLRRRADGNYRIGIAPLDNLAVEAYADCTDRFRRNVISLPEALHPMAPFVVNNFLMMIYTFATSERGTLMVHASVIRYEGHGYLFLGKSGTGKSTHTRLWLKYIEGSRQDGRSHRLWHALERQDALLPERVGARRRLRPPGAGACQRHQPPDGHARLCRPAALMLVPQAGRVHL